MNTRDAARAKVRDLTHFVGGKHVKGESGRFGDVFNPTAGALAARVPLASKSEVERVIANAKEAFAGWSETSPLARARVMFRFKELIALAKKEPGKIDFASSGNGGAQHLVTELFMYMSGIKMNHVPYKGSGPAQQDLMSGIIKVSFVGTPIAIPHLKSGRLNALGVSTAKRSPEMPEVPTIAEAGVPGYEATVWIGMLAPAGTPSEIVAKLNGEISKLVRTDEMQKLLTPTGMEPDPDTPMQFGAYLKADYDKWGKVVRDSGATVN